MPQWKLTIPTPQATPQRVRRVSLTIGRDLRLSARQLGVLGAAALFHDIGTIGKPDSILTSPIT